MCWWLLWILEVLFLTGLCRVLWRFIDVDAFWFTYVTNCVWFHACYIDCCIRNLRKHMISEAIGYSAECSVLVCHAGSGRKLTDVSDEHTGPSQNTVTTRSIIRVCNLHIWGQWRCPSSGMGHRVYWYVSMSVYEGLAASVFGKIIGYVADGVAKCSHTTLGRKVEISNFIWPCVYGIRRR